MTQRQVFLDIDLTIVSAAAYIGDAAVALAIEKFAFDSTTKTGFFGPDTDVIIARLSAEVIALGGVLDVTEIRADFTASPTPTANLVIGVREVATIDDADIVVLST